MKPSSDDAPEEWRPSVAMTRIGQALTVLLAIIGGCLGVLLVEFGVLVFSKLPDQIPAPHVIPKVSGGTPLALAMIDDLLCERFDRPSRAWYAARNRLRLEAIAAERAKLKPGEMPSAEFLARLDDVAVGYDHLGEPAKAIELMEEKLTWLQPVEKAWIESTVLAAIGHPREEVTPPKHDALVALYRTYANLGTHLIHAHLPAATKGDLAARRRVTEGLTNLKLAVAVEPDAHLGREVWQIVACEFLVAAIDRPKLLTTYDIIGNRWLTGDSPQEARPNKPTWPALYAGIDDPLAVIEILRRPDAIDDHTQIEVRERLRKEISTLGAEGDWKTEFLTSLAEPVAFDEPALGILGLWTIDSGSAPHLALALAGICERTGESELAWKAYERTSLLASGFSADEAAIARLRAYCESRQTALEPSIAPERKQILRDDFARELKRGLDLQVAREKYEEAKIGAGVSPDDLSFYNDWDNNKPPILTDPATLDLVQSASASRRSTIDLFAGMLLLAGAGALFGQLIARYALLA